MENLYWFTDSDGNNVLVDFYGTEQAAVAFAEQQVNFLGKDIFINSGESIVDVVNFPF